MPEDIMNKIKESQKQIIDRERNSLIKMRTTMN